MNSIKNMEKLVNKEYKKKRNFPTKSANFFSWYRLERPTKNVGALKFIDELTLLFFHLVNAFSFWKIIENNGILAPFSVVCLLLATRRGECALIEKCKSTKAIFFNVESFMEFAVDVHGIYGIPFSAKLASLVIFMRDGFVPLGALRK